MTYDWLAALAFLASLIAMTAVLRFFLFRLPGVQRMRALNEEADRAKLSRKRFREAVKVNNRAAMVTNAAFYLTVLPLSVSLSPLPWWRHLVDIVVVLLVFDFMYYLVHRFLFHGRPLRKVHALHHQARTPTYVDSLYVHPVETVIGLLLFLGSIPIVALAVGAPLNAFSMAVATLIFTQINTLNHVYVNLPFFPYKTADYITSIHAAHHVDMNQGNYATLTMIYDWMLGTLEKPVSREAA